MAKIFRFHIQWSLDLGFLDLGFLDLGHSLDLEHKTPVTDLGWYIKRCLDLGHLFSDPFVQNLAGVFGKILNYFFIFA